MMTAHEKLKWILIVIIALTVLWFAVFGTLVIYDWDFIVLHVHLV